MTGYRTFQDDDAQPSGDYYIEDEQGGPSVPHSNDRLAYRGVEVPTQRPKGAYDPREYFGRKLDEDQAKRTPAGGSWYPASGPSRGAAFLRPVKHEQSETQEVPGGYRQVYGRRTPKAGQPIPKRYAFEQAIYPNEQEALGSAIVRSDLEGRRLGAEAMRRR